jgi:hypothetical protein
MASDPHARPKEPSPLNALISSDLEFFADDCVLEPWPKTVGTRFEGGRPCVDWPRASGPADVHYGDDEHWVCGDHAVSRWCSLARRWIIRR